MPAPGSPAEKALEDRRIKSGKEHKKFSIPGLSHDDVVEEVQDAPVVDSKPKSGQRQQPKRKKRVKPPVQTDGKPGTKQQVTKPDPKQPGTKQPPSADSDA
jgi:hypothetical protein